MPEGINLSSGFTENAQQPLDLRIIQLTVSDRNAIPLYQRFFGLIVTVNADATLANNGTYILANPALGGTDTDLSNNANWIFFVSTGSGTFVDNEIVSGTGTAWTLAGTPIPGSEHIYANGQRLIPGGVDYTITGATITTIITFATGTLLADYRK